MAPELQEGTKRCSGRSSSQKVHHHGNMCFRKVNRRSETKDEAFNLVEADNGEFVGELVFFLMSKVIWISWTILPGIKLLTFGQ